MKTILFLILNLMAANMILATAVRHACNAANSQLWNVAAVGDSRAEQLGTTILATGKEFLQEAKSNGTPILLPNQVNIQNLGQIGSDIKDWLDLINKCLWAGRVFEVQPRSVIHLGGNSLGVYLLEKYEKRHASAMQYDITKFNAQATVNSWLNTIRNTQKATIQAFRKVTLKGFLRSPFRTISNFTNDMKNIILNAAKNLTGNPLLRQDDFKTQWEWEDQVVTDRITSGMRETILPHILNQSPDHRIILNTIPPTSPASAAIAATQGIPDQVFYFKNAIKLFNNLHRKYRKDLYLPLRDLYGERIILLDVYWAYWNNILKQNSSYYHIDGIHFSYGKDTFDDRGNKIGHEEGGMEYWAKMIATSMVTHRWFNTSLPPITFGQLYVDTDVQSSSAILNHKAKSLGIDSEVIEYTMHDSLNHGFSKYFPQDPIIITYMEIDFDFDNDKSFFTRNGDNRAYMVRGDIRTLYEGNGGPDGALGFPIQDEVVGSIFESYRTQVFECGTIVKNYFDLITPQKIIMNETTPECLAKNARGDAITIKGNNRRW